MPPGVYWVDYDPKSAGGGKFSAWLRANKAAVAVRKTEMITGGSPWFTVWPNELWTALNTADRVWALLEVLRSINYPARDFGFWLNTAPHGMLTTKDDTVQKPDPPEPGWGGFNFDGLGLLLLLWVLSQSNRSN